MIAPTISFEVGLRCDNVHVVVSPFSGLRFCRTMGLGVFADLLVSGPARRARAHVSHYLLRAVFPIHNPTLTKGTTYLVDSCHRLFIP